MTPEQHNTLTQLVQIGINALAETAMAALNSCAPEIPTDEKNGEEKTENKED